MLIERSANPSQPWVISLAAFLKPTNLNRDSVYMTEEQREEIKNPKMIGPVVVRRWPPGLWERLSELSEDEELTDKEHGDGPEVGYGLSATAWGKGFGTEALRGYLQWFWSSQSMFPSPDICPIYALHGVVLAYT
jgi:RimJ/RimL family protein N-acetyltransferase